MSQYWASSGSITSHDMTGVDGWLPISEQQYEDALAAMLDGKRVVVDGRLELVDPPTIVLDAEEPEDAQPLTRSDYAFAIQSHVDAIARDRDYDNGVSLASYVSSSNAVWAAEAAAYIAWRDAVWSYAYRQLDAVQSGTRAQPTVSELLEELPIINWPVTQ